MTRFDCEGEGGLLYWSTTFFLLFHTAFSFIPFDPKFKATVVVFLFFWLRLADLGVRRIMDGLKLS